MKKAKILHNPEAGEGETSEQKLVQMMEAAGFKCSYSSTKDGRWENLESKGTDFLVLAGGDGTVRKIATELLQRKVLEKKLPVALLPMGTANNIAKTLGLSGETESIIQGWTNGVVKQFDIGIIKGLNKPDFFLESFGYGLFPKLMQQMKKRSKDDIDDPAKKLEAALQLLRELIPNASAKSCHVKIDGQNYSGKFLLIEVMNIRSIGPNLQLAPEADPGDGVFDVVFIPEDQREKLLLYVEKKLDGVEIPFEFPFLPAKTVSILWDGKHAHVDDQYHEIEKPEKVKIELRQGALDFLVPKNQI